MKLTFSALVLVAVTMILTMVVQPAFAPRTCGGCVLFLKLTAQFERDVGQSILEFAAENHPNNYAEFKQLTGQFKKDVLEPDGIINYNGGDTLTHYHDSVSRIFLGGPDTISELIEKYIADISGLEGPGPR